ncbi:Extracellular matrix-binding ebh [Babesia ovata]|uniref:Extracellular matrix-binding ebh n=1 Tax=Babesia ovata TaxID=189622 RepID=A0A2H6K7L4_9APIC|nr:Extracellular matrix-binding ebh [Babesia ovata]GBE58987.1 Extracellular matrix-binding ebh [Babesia ovata]
MAPKALTDCPENLREAIDWLIQVKQGHGIPRLSEALGKLFDNVIQDAERSLSSLSEADEPSAGDVISKLQGFRSSFPKDSANSNKNILHNVCSSLERFLGYRSPGTYDGSGIVYGSASRLCDAIVTFLYRVISDVRDNQPYVVGRVLLGGLVGDLVKARWTGHHGFKAVVPKVASVLGTYNQNVKASNDKVKRPISDIIAYVKSEGGELPPKISKLNKTNPSESDVKTAEELAKECVGRGKEFGKAFTSKTHKHYMKDAFDDLNASLRDKIHNARNSVGRETAMLSRWSKKQYKNYEAMVKLIKQAFSKLKAKVNSKIEKEVTDLVNNLKGLVRRILAQLENISKTLASYVVKLETWMKDATEFVDNVLQKQVNEIVKELDADEPSKTPNHKKNLDEAIKKVENKLEKSVGDLQAWKQVANQLLEGTITSSNEVHGKLDHTEKVPPEGTTQIGKGIKKIEDAKQKITDVNAGLQTVHSNLEAWNAAAKDVLSNVIQRAESVRGGLDPNQKDDNHPIGHNIDKIKTSNESIQTANSRLLQQLGRLNSWIGAAEKIRKVAEEKAKEAYNKLDVNRTLAKKIGEIEEANELIKSVHSGLNGVHSNLGRWKGAAQKVLDSVIATTGIVKENLEPTKIDDAQGHPIGHNIGAITQARQGIVTANQKLGAHLGSLEGWKGEAYKVIGEAVSKAEEVYNKLDTNENKDPIGKKIKTIDDAQKAIDSANSSLRDEVTALGNWKRAAGEIVQAGQNKCDAILEKVGTDGNSKGDTIYKKAKKLSEDGARLFKAASEAKSLVESKVTAALGQVKDMDSKLREDLFKVKKNITEAVRKLGQTLETNVKNDLHKLEQGVNGGVKQYVHQLREHINKSVKKIRGSAGTEDDWKRKDAKGLLGIESAIKHYANAFSGADSFNTRVQGWLDAIWGKGDEGKENHKLQEWLKAWITAKGVNLSMVRLRVLGGISDMEALRKAIIEKIKGKFKDDAGKTAGEKVESVKGDGKSIEKNVQAVRDGCNEFVSQLDVKFKNGNQIAKEIAQAVADEVKGKIMYGTIEEKHITPLVEATMIALRTTVHQVASEIDSILLSDYRMGGEKTGIHIAKALDKAVKATRDLETTLSKPTSEQGSGKNGNGKADEEIKGELDKSFKKEPGATGDPSKYHFDSHFMNDFSTESSRLQLGTLKSSDGNDDVLKQQFGDDDSSKRITKFAQGKFTGYQKYVTDKISSLKTDTLQNIAEAGDLPKDIGEITTVGLEPFAQNGVDTILSTGEKTFKIPSYAIETELKAIAWLVDKGNGQAPAGKNGDEDGVKDLLKRLQEGLQNGKLKELKGKNVKGLAKIHEAIQNLKRETYVPKSGEIGTAVNLIKAQLEELRKQLKKDGQNDKTAVVNALNDLQKEGLGKNSNWNPTKSGNPVDGLMKIHEDIKKLHDEEFTKNPSTIGEYVQVISSTLGELQSNLESNVTEKLEDLREYALEYGGNWTVDGKFVDGIEKIKGELQAQNKTLSQQPGKIDKAIEKIRLELALIGFRLNDKDIDSDVVDQLTRLKEKIGMGDATNGNLQYIYDVIQKLQEGEFTHRPIEIRNSNEAIKSELIKLRTVLQGHKDSDVILTLNDLQNNGLSGGKWNKHGNEKGLDAIKNALQLQQSDLNKQPGNIDQGVKEITGELTKLQTQLTEQVTSKLETLKDQGLEKVDKWTVDSQQAKGLTKITGEIDEIKSKDVEDVKHQLKMLCSAIKHGSRALRDNLKYMKETLIDEGLKKIKDQINSLRSRQLEAAIRECRAFIDRDADVFKKRCIDELTKYVDQELKASEEELLQEARRQYVSTIQEMLMSFVAKVETELEELPEEIDRDLTIGFKGFMKTLEDGTTDDVSTGKGENINKLVNVKYPKDVSALSSAFMKFFGPLKDYVKNEIMRAHDEESKKTNPSLPPPAEPYAPKLYEVNAAINTVLIHIQNIQGYDHRLPGLLNDLIKALGEMKPETFGKITTPLLNTVGRGLREFVAEFGDAYVSTYSGAECRDADADKYAKVLLSMIPMAHDALSNLETKCGTNWRNNKICEFTPDDRDNGLGNCLAKCGYKVSLTDGLQEGELQNQFSGGAVYELLKSPVENVSVKMLIDGKSAEKEIKVVDILALCHNMLCRYLQACHLKVHASPRYPCTVRDMLSWLTGLQYTPVADQLTDHCRALLNRNCDDNDTPNREDKVMVQCINGLPFTIAEACSYANSLLVTIQGRGRGFDLAAYPYSVDFANNTAQLYYPDDPAEVLDMLRGIVCRLCSVLYFLYAQCCRATAETKGWRECHYGRQVPSSHWQCNTFDRQATDASHNCPPTSPLQSFLTDSCPNLLPHKLTATDNAIECVDCPGNLPGQQCLTPLGFWDLGLAASVERTGKDLAKSLGRLCSDADACLFQLCRTLSLLCPSAPQSLGDVFALFTHLLRTWDHESSRGAYSHHESYVTHLNDKAIDSLFPLWPQLHGSYQNAKLTDALKALVGHDHGDDSHDALSSLSAEPPCQSPSGCAPFLQPLALHANHTFPQKHAQLYISWSLLDALNNIDCTAHGCATCPSSPGNHGDKDACHCPSVVECGGPLPALYRYGFTYRNAHVLVAGSQRTRCSDLNDQLTKALHSNHFTELFHQIDEFLYCIRLPFLLTTVALWLIATLYILGVLLYRMDVLRIRSHLLTTAASHQVDVKALLTTSRKMLSLYHGVDYFDDDPMGQLDASQ